MIMNNADTENSDKIDAAQQNLLSIKSLSLTNFRNYTSAEINVNSDIILLCGDNGAGKTNILEAISLLSPGRGIRKAKNNMLINNSERDVIHHKKWAVFANIYTPAYGDISLATGNVPSEISDGKEKRIIKLNGNKISQNDLTRFISVSYLTPSQDHIFTEGTTSRRQFLDRLSSHFYTDHIKHLSTYNHFKNERKKILAMSNLDTTWLAMIEKKMAEQAVAIADARIETIILLQNSIMDSESCFPKAIISPIGETEEFLQQNSALETEEFYIKKLHENRNKDSLSNKTNFGIHKSDFSAIHPQKKLRAELCSMGEQKALILSIIIANFKAKKKFSGYSPIVLLDEVITHLDDDKRESLLSELLSTKAQYWITGTDSFLFKKIIDKSQLLTVENATVLG